MGVAALSRFSSVLKNSRPPSRSGSGGRGGFPSSPSPWRSDVQGVPTDREEDGDEGERGPGGRVSQSVGEVPPGGDGKWVAGAGPDARSQLE